MITTQRDGDVWLLDLGHSGGDDDHRFDPERIAALTAALDEVEAFTGPAALVLTAQGKFWSNGLEPERFGTSDSAAYLASFQRLLARFLASPVPSVAALQGHTYAGGLLLALALDQRVMRKDRGFACLPEVLIGFPFPGGLGALAQARLAPPVAHAAMTTGRRYSGPEAVAAGIVDATADEHRVVADAVERAAALAALRGPAYASIKADMYAGALRRLTTPTATQEA